MSQKLRLLVPPKRREKKDDVRGEEDGDEGMWVEKPAPEVVRQMAAVVEDVREHPPVEAETEGGMEGVVGPPRGRKRAVDFM